MTAMKEATLVLDEEVEVTVREDANGVRSYFVDERQVSKSEWLGEFQKRAAPGEDWSNADIVFGEAL